MTFGSGKRVVVQRRVTRIKFYIRNNVLCWWEYPQWYSPQLANIYLSATNGRARAAPPHLGPPQALPDLAFAAPRLRGTVATWALALRAAFRL